MKKEGKKEPPLFDGRRVKVSQHFVIALSLVSILGFIAIISQTIFEKVITSYVESFWMAIIGIGLIIEVRIKQLVNIRREGLTKNNFTHLITIIIGALAIIAGIFSFPPIAVTTAAFQAIKGIISIIAIIVIIIQTWIIG